MHWRIQQIETNPSGPACVLLLPSCFCSSLPSEKFHSKFKAPSVACTRLLLCNSCRMKTVRSSLALRRACVWVSSTSASSTCSTSLPFPYGSQGSKPVAQFHQESLGFLVRPLLGRLCCYLHGIVGGHLSLLRFLQRSKPGIQLSCQGACIASPEIVVADVCRRWMCSLCVGVLPVADAAVVSGGITRAEPRCVAASIAPFCSVVGSCLPLLQFVFWKKLRT